MSTMSAGPRPFWQPHLAGALLGLGLLMTFVLTGHGLGASGFTTALAATRCRRRRTRGHRIEQLLGARCSRTAAIRSTVGLPGR